mgnify:CR=1 FL=1
MYWIIFKLVLITMTTVGALIPIVPRFRKRVIKILNNTEDGLYSGFLEYIDGGFKHIGEATVAVLAYMIILIFIFLLSAILSFIWPLVIFLLVVSLIFYKLNKKQ